MISVFVYLRSPDGIEQSINALATALGVEKAYRFKYGETDTDYSFFNDQKNSLFYEQVSGDFLCSVDLNIFFNSYPRVIETLRELSKTGLEIAIPVEDEKRPFSYKLFSAGKRKNIEIIEDDDVLRIST